NFKGYRGTGTDISAEVKAEEMAATAQERFMAAIESVADGFALFDADDRMVFCNSRFKAMNLDLAPKLVPGVTFEALLRDNIAANRILDALGDEEAFIRERMAQHRNPTGPLVQQRRDGLWLELREERTPEGATFLVNTDITERKQAEQALQESEALFRSFIDNLPTEIFVRDTTGRFALVNRAWERVQGVSSQDVIGKTAHDIYPKDQADIYAAQDQAVLATGQVLDRELEFREGNGSHFLHTIKFPIPGADGEVTAIGGIAVDITERKRAEQALRESEQRLQRAVLDAPIPIMIHAEDGEVLMISRQWSTLTGYTYAEIPTISRWTELAYSVRGITEELREKIGKLYDIEEQTREGENHITTKSGGHRIWDFRSSPLGKLPDGRRIVISMAMDVTERRLAHEELERRVKERTAELRAAQAELIRQERLATLGQLTATVSHELRNPLGVIRTSAFVVRDGLKAKAPRARRALERIERSVVRCDRIIDEMLDFTRIAELDFEMVPIDTWLVGVLEEQVVPREVTVHNEFALPGVGVDLDSDRLRRAVINVFDNACQAMIADESARSENGEHRLTVRTGAAAGRIELVFEDTGPGIPPEVLPRVFEPLFSTKGFGVGLGLSVVHQIMEQHGGGNEIELIAGGGARVRLWLPGDEPGP
ncbi:MAG: PAS domain S-box protein, partial [Kiloniellales bacterium]